MIYEFHILRVLNHFYKNPTLISIDIIINVNEKISPMSNHVMSFRSSMLSHRGARVEKDSVCTKQPVSLNLVRFILMNHVTLAVYFICACFKIKFLCKSLILNYIARICLCLLWLLI